MISCGEISDGDVVHLVRRLVGGSTDASSIWPKPGVCYYSSNFGLIIKTPGQYITVDLAAYVMWIGDSIGLFMKSCFCQ